MEKAHTQETLQLTERLAKTTNWFLGAALLGVVLCAVAWFQNAKFFFVSYLTAFSFFLAIALGAHELFHWTHEELRATDALIQSKSNYLNEPFFYIRAVVYMIAWSLLGWWFLRTSRLQDQTRDPNLTHKMSKMSAFGFIVFALSMTFWALDWIMSLDPHWFSTMFGVYYFAGAVVAFYCALILLTLWLKATGHVQHSINVEHYHDMGKLLFGHNVFWTYIGFSQFMLIWYANI